MLPFWDLLFLALVMASCVFLYRRIKSLNMTLIMFVLAISLAGIFGQILEALKISTNGDQMKAMICGSLLIAIIFTNKANCFKLRTAANLNALIFVFIATIFVIGTAAISRVFAKDQIQGALTQFNYLGAEDNGAWLDISKKLLSGDSIPYQSVGGPLVALLAICQSCATFLVYILTGKKNDLAIVLNSVVIAYMVLPIFAAFAFSQITERLIKITRLASLTITSCFWFPIYGSLLLAQSSGHLSFIYVATVFTCCVWAISIREPSAFWEQKIAQLCLIVTMPVWLPLNVLTVVLVLIFCVQIGKHILSETSLREKLVVSSLAGVPVLAVSYLLILSLSYSASSASQVKGLIGAAGGTGSASHVFLVVLVISMLGISLKRNHAILFNPINILKIGFGYVLVVIAADYWMTGQMNYGSTKLMFAASIIATPIAAYCSLESFLIQRETVQIKKFSSVLFVAICLLGLLDGTSLEVLNSVTPLRWPSVDKSIETSWENEILITKEPKNFDEIPIGCITRDDSGDLSVDMDTYSCTRTLLSISGIWSKGTQLVEFQLWPLKTKAVQLQSIDPDLLDKKLLILDVVEHKVVDTITLSEFIDYLTENPPIE
jgi:hypothetical protein